MNDFLEWHNTGLLQLSPKFQRRDVWSEKAKSYLVDTIISGKPIPKILLTQDLRGRKNIRIIIDGQQRLRAIIGYINDEFSIKKVHNEEYGGKKFSDLDEDVQSEILKYEIGTDLIYDLNTEDTLDIFSRLNTYSVRLNNQELLNASYLGGFKQSSYKLGHRYAEFWKENNIITDKQIARMAEAELASDLLVVVLDKVQSSKSISKYYDDYDDDDKLPLVNKAAGKFEEVIKWIGAIYPENELKQTNYSRVQLFYSLFCVVAHGLYGISNVKSDRIRINKGNIGRLRSRLDDISARYDNPDSPELVKLVDSSRRGTTDVGRRIERAEIIIDMIRE